MQRKRAERRCVARLSRCRATPASARGLHHVLGGRALLALHEIELHGLPFSETLEAIALNRAVVHEAVFVPAVRSDKAKTFRVVEPLHFAGRTHTCSSLYGRRTKSGLRLAIHQFTTAPCGRGSEYA